LNGDPPQHVQHSFIPNETTTKRITFNGVSMTQQTPTKPQPQPASILFIRSTDKQKELYHQRQYQQQHKEEEQQELQLNVENEHNARNHTKSFQPSLLRRHEKHQQHFDKDATNNKPKLNKLQNYFKR